LISIYFNQNKKLTASVDLPDADIFETLNDSPTLNRLIEFWQLPQNSSSANQLLVKLQNAEAVMSVLHTDNDDDVTTDSEVKSLDSMIH